jgi:hypothetical protein
MPCEIRHKTKNWIFKIFYIGKDDFNWEKNYQNVNIDLYQKLPYLVS